MITLCYILGIGFIITLGIIIYKDNPPTKNKRIVKVTKESGKIEYHCEQEYKDGSWKTITYPYGSGPYCEYMMYRNAIFNSELEAIKFIGKDPDKIIVSKEIIYESKRFN